MAKETMSSKIEKAIESATTDFNYWVGMEQKAWETLSKATEIKMVDTAEQAIKSIHYARMNKAIADDKLAALRALQK